MIRYTRKRILLVLREEKRGDIPTWRGCQEGTHTHITALAADHCRMFGCPQRLPLLLSTPSLPTGSKLCISVHEAHRDKPGGKVWRSLLSLTKQPFHTRPQLCLATPSAPPQVRATSFCQGAAAASQRPKRKMPAMTFCEGNR